MISKTDRFLDRWKSLYEELFTKEEYIIPQINGNGNGYTTSQKALQEEWSLKRGETLFVISVKERKLSFK